MMFSLFAHPYTIFLMKLVLGFVFLLSGLRKVFDRKGTIQTVVSYEVLPPVIARIYGTILPWVELTLATFLLLGVWERAAACGVSLLLLSFGVAVSANLLRGKEMRCGCSGRRNNEMLTWRTLTRIIILFIFAVGVGWLDKSYYSLKSYLTGNMTGSFSPALIDFIPVLFTVVAVALTIRLFSVVISMYRGHRILRQVIYEQLTMY